MTPLRLALLPLLVAFVAPAADAADPPRRLNVVVLLADDWRHDTLGCAGHPVLKTPHLDALAAEGFRFTRACVTTSICGVSRASLLTGQWMSRHGNEAFAMFKTPWAETFPALLRANGYWVGHVGKWHNGPFPKDKYDFGRSYAGTHWVKRPNSEPVHVTKLNEADALEFLKGRPKDKPFCLTVAFFAAHAEDGNPKQYLPQPESAALYADATIPVPATASDAALKRLPPFLQQPANEGRKRFGWRFDTPEKYQAMMKNYYRLCTEVDAACGRVLAELKGQGVLDDTLVLFITDNGRPFPRCKTSVYDSGVQSPFIVRWPKGGVAAGSTCDALVSSVDIAPAFLAAAGIDALP
ncbi:MAG TPA: sulfatase-like hydrolase/transferase, partial [Gemmataceae bacterium]|nr:sulfatase-like hydrolase/transferase [Gemmataceae bacterium]